MGRPTARSSRESASDPSALSQADDAESEFYCDRCPLRSLPFCSALVRDAHDPDGFVRPRHLAARARHTIYRRNQKSDDIIVVREGWAVRFAVAANGRRQILALLLPGEVASTTSIFRSKLPFSIQTLTPLRYCAFNRAEVLAFIEKNPEALRAITEICVEDREHCDQRMLDFVSRPAEERIVLLLLDLYTRMEKLGAVEALSFAFPLTQQQMADAVGLTQVHVNRVLRRLKTEDLIEIAGGTLSIRNVGALRAIIETP